MRYAALFAMVFLALTMRAQEVVLPTDFRQHNLTQYNGSFLNPVFSIDRNAPESIALWSRWQWQIVDTDPSTWILNYTRQLNNESTAGLGVFQHNTGTYTQTGGVLNYAYALPLESNAEIAFGLNLFVFNQRISQDPFNMGGIEMPVLEDADNFILRAAPSLQFRISDFSIGLVAENLFDYNFSSKESESLATQKTYIGQASYRISVFSDDDTYLMPTVYMKTFPETDNQYGLTALFSTRSFWIQGGYNSFYGVSGGIGGRFFKDLAIGAMVEYGIDSSLDNQDPSFELLTAYSFGERDRRKKIVGFEVPEDEEIMVNEPPLDERIVAEEKESDQEAQRARERQVLDSIAEVRREEALAAARMMAEERRKDSLETVRKQQEEQAAKVKVTPQPGERYQEAYTEGKLQPGYYLIANVFGTQTYFTRFMKTLSDRGLNPKSFYRSENKYNYVYLQRYLTIEEARRARDSKFNGLYGGELWIFRVLPK